MSHAAHHPEDKKAAYTGLITGAIFIGAVMYGLVLWTNAKFEGHKAEAAPAAETAPTPQ